STTLHSTTLHPATFHPTSLHSSRYYSPRPDPPVQPVRPLRVLRIQTRQLHTPARAVDELELSDVHPHVRHARARTRGEEQHVTGTERIHHGSDLGAGAGLIAAHARQADAVLTVGILNQARAIEPVVRPPAPDVRCAEGLDGGLHHVAGVAADGRGGGGGRQLGRTAVPASPWRPAPRPRSPSHRDAEHRADTAARVAARIPKAARPAILEPGAQLRP